MKTAVAGLGQSDDVATTARRAESAAGRLAQISKSPAHLDDYLAASMSSGTQLTNLRPENAKLVQKSGALKRLKEVVDYVDAGVRANRELEKLLNKVVDEYRSKSRSRGVADLTRGGVWWLESTTDSSGDFKQFGRREELQPVSDGIYTLFGETQSMDSKGDVFDINYRGVVIHQEKWRCDLVLSSNLGTEPAILKTLNETPCVEVVESSDGRMTLRYETDTVETIVYGDSFKPVLPLGTWRVVDKEECGRIASLRKGPEGSAAAVTTLRKLGISVRAMQRAHQDELKKSCDRGWTPLEAKCIENVKYANIDSECGVRLGPIALKKL
ncbi:MAG: hypothetical protein ACPGU1_23125 [Myxococcota bacterium]